MEGDLFEMEDQRNWLDGSFKIFCPPLRLPFPVEIREGTRIEQAVTLALRGRTTTTRHRSTPVAFEISSDLTWSLPSIGVARAGHGEPLTERELSQLRLLNLARLRSEFHLKEDGIGGRLQEDAIEAKALAVPLEVALFLSDDAEAELDRLVEALVATRPDVCRWLVFHVAEWTTSARWVSMARRRWPRTTAQHRSSRARTPTSPN